MDDYLRSKEAFTIALNTLKSELDYTTAIKTAKEEGIEQGLEQGIEQGIEQGENNKVTELIKNMFQNNFTIEQILLATNESEEKILEIKKNMKH